MSIDSNEPSINVNIWEGMNERQIKAVSYKLLNPDATYDDISKEIDIPKGTLQQWRLCKITDKIRANKLQATIDYMERLSIKAARVLESQLDSEDERVSQAAAKDLLDRFMGKATQRSELTGKDGEPIETISKGYIKISPDDWDGGDGSNTA